MQYSNQDIDEQNYLASRIKDEKLLSHPNGMVRCYADWSLECSGQPKRPSHPQPNRPSQLTGCLGLSRQLRPQACFLQRKAHYAINASP